MPPIRCTNRSGMSDQPSSTARTKSPSRMEPCVLIQRRQSTGRRAANADWPRLGQQQQLKREPHQGEVETPVPAATPAMPTASRMTMTATRPPAHRGPARRPRSSRGTAHRGRWHRGCSSVPEGTEERGQNDLRAPLVGHPATVRLRVAERVEPHEGMVGQHPLTGGQRPETHRWTDRWSAPPPPRGRYR